MSVVKSVDYTAEKNLMRQLHGNIITEESGFLRKVTQKHEQLNKKAVETYYGNWEDKKDIKNTEGGVIQRRANAQVMTNAFYDLVTDFYEYGICTVPQQLCILCEGAFGWWCSCGYAGFSFRTGFRTPYAMNLRHHANRFRAFVGWGQSFHFAKLYKVAENASCMLAQYERSQSWHLPIAQCLNRIIQPAGDTFEENTKRHEAYLALRLGLGEGMKCLDVGCGVGGPLREVAKSAQGAHITGINNNAYQIERCFAYSKKYGLSNVTDYVKGDFTNMEDIPDETFDRVFSVEATVHAPKLEYVYAEIYRVLKPGGKYACYEWLTTEQYDENDLTQKKVIHGIEEGNSISKLYSIPQCLEALRSVGFTVLDYKDIAVVDEATEPWYYALSRANGIRGFARSPFGRIVTHTVLTILQTLRLVPKGTMETSNLLNNAADRLVEGGEMNIFTPMFFFLVEKPAEAK
ncbi:hypothetical protein BZG36_02450 [Bifiguratus adelaidae]|uniref:Sterol 24-C-methyltransferase n=1 Tax=Bifiguratus adelaidae TaxID=1938954 RepID=A0A261Y3N8_9FUNG|nr:hypothetical protein BZG36_02450 [Bifiguratus adelaidae]